MPDLTGYGQQQPTKDPSTGIMNLAAPFVGDAVNGLISLFTAKRNRQNALDDWNRQNEYNSPAAQMQRYKEAGLSPHLIYGQTNTAAPIRSTEMIAPTFDSKNVDFITRTQNLNQQRLNTDNLQKQLEVQDANIKLINANTFKAQSETDWRNLNTNRLQNNIMPYDFDYYNSRSRQMAQAINNATVQNEVLSNTAEKIKSDTRLNTTKKALMLSNIHRISELIRGDRISNTQKLLIGNLTQQAMIQDQGLKNDKRSMEQKRLELMQRGLDQSLATQIASLLTHL